MFSARVEPGWDVQRWRACARAAWRAGLPPERVAWPADGQADLVAGADVEAQAPVRDPPRVPAALPALAADVVCHRDRQRHALLYRLLWRIAGGDRHLLDRAVDGDVQRAQALQKAVRRDSHKMKAFVRFRELPGQPDTFVAWFEPDHFIVDRVAPFFARRFAGMRWTLLTPYRSVRWNGDALEFGGGAQRADAPADDARESLWRTYYASIFNPARLNVAMMQQEMPRKYWKLLPEAELLPALIGAAGARVQAMAERAPEPPRRRIPVAGSARARPAREAGGLAGLRAAAGTCRRCELWRPATQVVFGEGAPDARIMIVGEQPGDEEDLRGRPFVGPAGRLLDRALAELGIDRARLYLTNAVKHFRFQPRGKRRLHRNPAAAHVQACRDWLVREHALIRPAVVACLGATAAAAVLGPGLRLMSQRGRWHALDGGGRAFATVHPSWVLRQREGPEREAAYRGFVDDLRLLLEAGAGLGRSSQGDAERKPAR